MPSESCVIVLAGQPMSRAATFAVIVVGQGIYGVAMGMSNSHETSYRQLVTPDELQARTNTTLRSLNRAAVVVTAPIAGILADAWGIRPICCWRRRSSRSWRPGSAPRRSGTSGRRCSDRAGRTHH